jgi:signal transduction histidine kinase/CheY-like chemotaxis protein
MRASLRAKLLAIVASTALAFVVILVTNRFVAHDVEAQLQLIQDRQIPKLELGPTLQADFAALKHSYQDAVAAHDREMLQRARDLRERILRTVERGRGVLDPKIAHEFEIALGAYHEAALDVAQRMLASEAGEAMVDAMRGMQAKQAKAQELLDHLVVFDQNDLKSAFDATYAAERSGAKRELVIILAALTLAFFFTLRNARQIASSLSTLQAGFTRFGEGRFHETIATKGDDEIAKVAKEANRMAATLAQANAERELADWVKSGQMEIGDELRGELDDREVATRAVRALAMRLSAPAAAIYAFLAPDLRSNPPMLKLLGSHALASTEAKPAFVLGEGLIGEAARGTEIVVIDEVPEDFVRIRSGLGDAAPRCIALVPLVIDGAAIGVLELALFTTLSKQARELLTSARATIAIAIAVAQSRGATQRLLEETQRQAQLLRAQEEELKSTNEELRCQQEELRQTNAELATQRKQLEVKASELATVSAYKSQFLANMSHELRTPLNSMLLLSKLLEENGDGNLTPKQVEYARTVHTAGRDLLTLIDQVLDLAKVEAGKQTVTVEPIGIREIADRLRRTFEPLAHEKKLTLAVELAENLPDKLTTDRQRIVQILTNLLGNAIKFTTQGSIRLRIERRANAIAFAVADTGAGIAREHQARIFEPFEQVDGSSQRKQGGTGLGLAISRELARLLGGELELESGVGRGSTFTLLLPEARATTSVSLAPRNPPELHLLVVEQDPIFAGVLGDIIRERGLTYLVASDASSGLRLARERKPLGIIVDLESSNGLIDKLRADPVTTAIPIHTLTGPKPVDRPELVRVIESLAGRREPHRVLVVERDGALGQTLLEQLTALGLSTKRVEHAEEGRALLERERYAIMIVDLETSSEADLAILANIKSVGRPTMPAIVIYTSRRLSRAEATRLEHCADAVVLKEGASTDRLIDEIRLFVRRLESSVKSPAASPASVRSQGDVRLGGRKILVVDDDMRTVYALSAMLRARGAEVIVAENGEVALEMLREHPDVNAILMDVMMPVMDGYEATRRVRAQAPFQKLPIVALTAKAMKGDRERCLEAGATDYLSKPIDADTLLSLLSTQLEA